MDNFSSNSDLKNPEQCKRKFLTGALNSGVMASVMAHEAARHNVMHVWRLIRQAVPREIDDLSRPQPCNSVVTWPYSAWVPWVLPRPISWQRPESM
ncbi:hypothetical protein DND58_18770 [Pseudomonas syringae pv. pisi]|nr:hypothetical protein DND62_17335 [Pseudomonas syringae pv. pisi]PYD28615.1 hypothetical protein DND67_18810 [Pseudomonas syringae pv. pisi]PYD30043.1 hypothetical protein DND58_18770 [Pseudomonas syringae pv. pisi]